MISLPELETQLICVPLTSTFCELRADNGLFWLTCRRFFFAPLWTFQKNTTLSEASASRSVPFRSHYACIIRWTIFIYLAERSSPTAWVFFLIGVFVSGRVEVHAVRSSADVNAMFELLPSLKSVVDSSTQPLEGAGHTDPHVSCVGVRFASISCPVTSHQLVTPRRSSHRSSSFWSVAETGSTVFTQCKAVLLSLVIARN